MPTISLKAIRVGNVIPNKIYVGNTEVSKIYVGSTQVWSKTIGLVIDPDLPHV